MIYKGLPMDYVLPDNGDGTKGGISCTTIVIPKGSGNSALAAKLIAFALTPGAQLMTATSNTPYGPVINGLDNVLRQMKTRVPFGDVTSHALRLSWDKAALDKFTQYVDEWNRKVQK